MKVSMWFAMVCIIITAVIGMVAGEYMGYAHGVNDVALPAYELGYADAILSCSDNGERE